MESGDVGETQRMDSPEVDLKRAGASLKFIM